MKYSDIDKILEKWGFSEDDWMLSQKNNLFNIEINTKLKIERLENELSIIENEVQFFTSQKKEGEDITSVTNDILNYIKIARQDLDKGQVDKAWKLYQLIKRLQYFTYSDNLIKKETKILLSESNKFNEWRKNAINEVLKAGDNDDISSGDIFIAAKLKDEHYDNINYKNKLAVFSIKTNFLLLFLIVSLLALQLYFVDLDRLIVDPRSTERSVNFFPLSLLSFYFGCLAVCLHTIFKLRSVSKIQKVSALKNGFYFTLIRLMIGGVIAVLVVIFLESEVSQLLIHNVSFRPNQVITYFLIAFLAGFAERLLFKL